VRLRERGAGQSQGLIDRAMHLFGWSGQIGCRAQPPLADEPNQSEVRPAGKLSPQSYDVVVCGFFCGCSTFMWSLCVGCDEIMTSGVEVTVWVRPHKTSAYQRMSLGVEDTVQAER
jgi:hypothetical protein